MPDTDWPVVAAAIIAIIALLASATKLADWWMRRLELDAEREADGEAFPPERSGVVRRDGVEERERKVAGE